MEKAFSEANASLVSLLAQVQNCYREGDFQNSLILCKICLMAYEEEYGPDDIKTMAVVQQLGLLLRKMSRTDEAEPYYHRCLRGFEKILGPDHECTLTQYNNTANLLKAQGKFSEARPLCEKALRGLERVCGLEHEATLMAMNDFAVTLEMEGKLAELVGEHDKAKEKYLEAKVVYERALQAFENLLGPHHPTSLGVVGNLADICFYLKEYQMAFFFKEKAIDGLQIRLGPMHPDTVSKVASYALILLQVDDFDKAEPYCDRAAQGK